MIDDYKVSQFDVKKRKKQEVETSIFMDFPCVQESFVKIK
jgi:hypothetical protein